MPGTLVAVSLNGPPLACPGLRSKVSSWLGPPAIHSRMHDRLRRGSVVARAARRPSQPDREGAVTPADDRFSHSRRDSMRGERGTDRLLKATRFDERWPAPTVRSPN